MRSFVYKVLYFFARIYWFLFRPRTYGVKCLVFFQDKVLLIRNSYGKDWWNLPGGGTKRGEMPEDAARREVKEETGVLLTALEAVGTFLTTEEYKRDTVFCFVAELKSEEVIVTSGEVKQSGWFDRSPLPVDRAPSVDRVLDFWKKHKKETAE